MGFFWKEDMLYTKRGELPKDSQTEWTTFFLSCREPIVIPDTESFAKFIATSLALSSSIKNVTVLLDGVELIKFDRKCSIPRPLDIQGASSYSFKSPMSYFTLESIDVCKIHTAVTISNSKQSNVL